VGDVLLGVDHSGVFVGVFVFRCSAYIQRLLFVLHRSLFILCRDRVFNKILLIQKKKKPFCLLGSRLSDVNISFHSFMW